MTRRTLAGGLVLLSCALLATAVPAPAEVNRIVLRVNDRIATLYDYERLKRERIDALNRSGISEEERQRQIASVGVDTMRNLFQEMLLLSRADQLEVRIAPSEVQQALEGTKESFGIENDEEYEEALRQSGLTRDGLRRQIENSLRIREVFGLEVYSEVDFEEEDLRRYYSQNPEEFRTKAAVRLREVIVLESSSLSSSERSELAARIASAAAAGETDALLAETEVAGTTTGWIELGWVESGDLDPQLEAALEGLDTGSMSSPTPARGGLHLLQVLELREARVREFSEVREELELAERSRRVEKRQAEYLRELESEAFVIANPPPEAAQFRAELGVEASPPVEDAVPPTGGDLLDG